MSSRTAPGAGNFGHPCQGRCLALRTMNGWQHRTLDYDPATDCDEEAWARAVAVEGWRTWHPSGVWVTIGSRRVRRWALRRPCAKPWSAHHHGTDCGALREDGAASSSPPT